MFFFLLFKALACTSCRFIIRDFTHTVNGTRKFTYPAVFLDRKTRRYLRYFRTFRNTFRRPCLKKGKGGQIFHMTLLAPRRAARVRDISEACQSAEMETQIHEQGTAVNAPTRHFIYDLRCNMHDVSHIGCPEHAVSLTKSVTVHAIFCNTRIHFLLKGLNQEENAKKGKRLKPCVL